MADPNWRNGHYYGCAIPAKGLAVARMIGHITYMSDASMAEKFGRRVKPDKEPFKFGADFEVEGYLRYRGDNFVKRFDANSYLYITKAIDYFNILNGHSLSSIFKGLKAKVLVIAFKSDWLYPAYQSQEIVKALKLAGVDASYCEINSTYGHDAFLLEVEQETQLIGHFLGRLRTETERKVTNVRKIEHEVIAGWVSSGASVLDLGCGDGELLSRLIAQKQVRAQGIEISDHAIHRCVAQGLSVFQEDIDTGLAEYADKKLRLRDTESDFSAGEEARFRPERSLASGQANIVGFPNFVHYRARFQLFFRGKVPVTASLPYEWYDTPNLHFLSIADFIEYCKKRDIRIEQAAFIGKNKKIRLFPNLFAEIGLFLLSK